MSILTIVAALLLGAASVVHAKPPAIETPATFATGLPGPEGGDFTKDRRRLVVGSTTGDVIAIDKTGATSVVATTGASLAGLTTLRDGRILAADLPGRRVWEIDLDAEPLANRATVFASDIGGPNFIVQTKRRRILVSASLTGEIVDITDGQNVVLASGLQFPNGLALGKEKRTRYLYVAELATNSVVRLPLEDKDRRLGPAEVYAEGLPIVDGIAFDAKGNLLAVGGGQLAVVHRKTREVEVLAVSPPLGAPANLVFGRGRGFKKKDLFLIDFGIPIGSGSTVTKVRYSNPGGKLRR